MKQRYNTIDTLRGIAILNMVIYHALWNLVFIFGVNIHWFTTSIGDIWQQVICQCFILLSGFCFSLSKERLKRGITILSASVLITVATHVFMPENRILFGVLSLIGSCMLIFIPLDMLFQNTRQPLAYAALSLVLFILLKNVSGGSIELFGNNLLSLPDSLYRNNLTAYLGFPPKAFISSDYFPIIPWFFLFSTGYFLFPLLKVTPLMYKLKCNVFELLGRHSLFIYIIHQPIVYFITYLIF